MIIARLGSGKVVKLNFLAGENWDKEGANGVVVSRSSW